MADYRIRSGTAEIGRNNERTLVEYLRDVLDAVSGKPYYIELDARQARALYKGAYPKAKV